MNKLIRKTIDYKKMFILLTIIMLYSFNCIANELSENEIFQNTDIVKWLKYDQAIAKSKIENVPALIYFYSDNCGWCRRLENETFTNQEIVKIMNEDFAIVKINSNSTEYVNVDTNKITERQLSMDIFQVRANPTIWFLDSDEKRITALPGFVESPDFINVLKYIKDGYYKKYDWPEYMENIAGKQ